MSRQTLAALCLALGFAVQAAPPASAQSTITGTQSGPVIPAGVRPSTPLAAYREKITFRVPVSLQKMIVQPGWTPVVSCQVFAPGNELLGHTTEPISLVGSGYSGTMRISVTPLEGKILGAADRYHCTLAMRSLDGHSAWVIGPNAPEWAQPKPGAPFTKKVEGRLSP